MGDMDRERLIREARMQTRALQRIGVWKRAALSVAVVGILLIYTGMTQEVNILRGVFGGIITVSGGAAALLIHIGYRNGKKNVERILEAAQR